MSTINWQSSEWQEHGFSAEHGGYVADVYPDQHSDRGWFWRVDATASVSEWPEIIDCDFAESEDTAKTKAQTALLKACV